MRGERYQELARELRQAQPGRSAMELFGVVARLYHAEKGATGRAPKFRLSKMGAALGLHQADMRKESLRAYYRQEQLRRADVGGCGLTAGMGRPRSMCVSSSGELVRV